MQNQNPTARPGNPQNPERSLLSRQNRNDHTIPPEFDATPILQMDARKLAGILKDPASTEFQKAKACERLAIIGTGEAASAISPLLADEHLSTYARAALEVLPGPEAGDALRGALGKVKGNLLVGIIISLGVRRDAGAVDPLARLLSGGDIEAVRAAAAALGRIGSPQAANALQEGLARARGPARDAIAAGGLTCAGSLLTQGERKQALALLDLLSRADIPKPVRLGAMQGVITAETSTSRPR